MYRTCPDCGNEFYDEEGWKKLCLTCWKRRKDKERANTYTGTSRLVRLETQINRLRAELCHKHTEILRLKTRTNPLENELKEHLRKLMSLCHPDKHAGSRVAHDEMIFLLSLRERISNGQS